MDGKRIGLIVSLKDLILSKGTFLESFHLGVRELNAGNRKTIHPKIFNNSKNG